MAQTDPISVLLVEDDPAARANIAEILVRAGMVVDLAEDGAEGLKRAADMIAAAKRPVIIMGRGAVWADAGDACLKLGDRIGSLIATSLLGDRSVLTVHGISAGWAVFLLGTVAVGHIRVGWVLRKNRLSGVGNAAALGLLTLTGWGLYYGTEEMRDLTVLAHWSLGLGFVAVLARRH